MTDEIEPRSTVVVRTNDIMRPALLETDEASFIEFYDKYGDLIAVMVRIFTDDHWGLVTPEDEDWDFVLEHYGIKRKKE